MKTPMWDTPALTPYRNDFDKILVDYSQLVPRPRADVIADFEREFALLRARIALDPRVNAAALEKYDEECQEQIDWVF